MRKVILGLVVLVGVLGLVGGDLDARVRMKGVRMSGGINTVNVFSPTDISDLNLWLDAADSFTVSMNGALVAKWCDKSGNGNDVAQSLESRQPTYNYTGMNSRATLEFDGADGLVSASTDWGTNFSLIAVVRNTNSSPIMAKDYGNKLSRSF